jgi:hypothetical protein
MASAGSPSHLGSQDRRIAWVQEFETSLVIVTLYKISKRQKQPNVYQWRMDKENMLQHTEKSITKPQKGEFWCML